MQAATDESTPPDIATSTGPFDMGQMLRGACALLAAGILGPTSGQRGVEDPVDVVVLVKYVPEPQGTPTLGEDLLLVREGVDGALDPGDEFAVEAALGLVEAHGGEGTLVSMGPEAATGGLREGFSMGAGGGVLVTDPALRGADALATARVLAAAVGRSPFDLVLAGVESTGGPPGTAPRAGGGDPRRTAVPHVEGHHGREVQAPRAALARRPGPVRRRRRPHATRDLGLRGPGEVGRGRDPGRRRRRRQDRRAARRGEGHLTGRRAVATPRAR